MKKYLGLAGIGAAVAATMVACGGGQRPAVEATPPAWVDTPPVIFDMGDQTRLPAQPLIVEPDQGKFTIAGTIVGYAGSNLILENNGDTLLIAKGTQTFQFTKTVDANASYLVTVKAQPNSPAQSCSISGSSGVATATVTSVIVNCASNATFAYLAKISGSIERFAYDAKNIKFGESLGNTDLGGVPAATNVALAKHPYKRMIYALQAGTNEISSFTVKEEDGDLGISAMKAVPAIADADDATINSIAARLIAHPNGKMLYSFDTARIYAHTLNEGGQPVSTKVINGPTGMKIYEAVLNPAGTGLFVHEYEGNKIDIYPVDLSTGNLGAAVSRGLTWPINRMSFENDGKTLFTNFDIGRIYYDVSDDFLLHQYSGFTGYKMGEVVSDPLGRFMFVIAPYSYFKGNLIPGFRMYEKVSGKEWVWTSGSAEVENPAFNLAAIDPLGKYVYMFGNDKVLGLPTGPALDGNNPIEITGVKSGRALLLY